MPRRSPTIRSPDVLAKLLTLQPGRIAALDEAAMVMSDGVLRTTAAWTEVAE